MVYSYTQTYPDSIPWSHTQTPFQGLIPRLPFRVVILRFPYSHSTVLYPDSLCRVSSRLHSTVSYPDPQCRVSYPDSIPQSHTQIPSAGSHTQTPFHSLIPRSPVQGLIPRSPVQGLIPRLHSTVSCPDSQCRVSYPDLHCLNTVTYMRVLILLTTSCYTDRVGFGPYQMGLRVSLQSPCIACICTVDVWLEKDS